MNAAPLPARTPDARIEPAPSPTTKEHAYGVTTTDRFGRAATVQRVVRGQGTGGNRPGRVVKAD